MSGEELIELYLELFGEQPFRLTTVSIDNEKYKEMISYCNLMGTPLTNEIINKFFGDNYDVIYPKDKGFKQFKKEN